MGSGQVSDRRKEEGMKVKEGVFSCCTWNKIVVTACSRKAVLHDAHRQIRLACSHHPELQNSTASMEYESSHGLT